MRPCVQLSAAYTQPCPGAPSAPVQRKILPQKSLYLPQWPELSLHDYPALRGCFSKYWYQKLKDFNLPLKKQSNKETTQKQEHHIPTHTVINHTRQWWAPLKSKQVFLPLSFWEDKYRSSGFYINDMTCCLKALRYQRWLQMKKTLDKL